MSRFARKDRWKWRLISNRRSGRSTVRLLVEALEDRTCPTVGHDTLATAIPIQFDQYHRADAVATITRPNEADLYEIRLTQNESILIGVQTASNGQSLLSALRVFDSSGHELTVNSFANSPIVFTASAAGTYYLGVSSTGNVAYDVTASQSGSGGTSEGDYDLRIVADIPDSDGNTSPMTATALSFAGNEATAAASIDGANDFDYYQVYLTAGHQVRFFADLGSNNSLDIDIGLTDPQGMQRFAFDQSQTGTNGADLGTLFTVPETGTYIVAVRASSRFSNFGAGLSTPGFIGASAGPYVLHVVDDPPDLVTTDFQVLSPGIEWGQSIQVRYTVTNQGLGDAGPFDVQFRLSGSTTFDSSEPAVDVAGGGDTVRFTSGLGAGQSITSVVTLQLPASPPAGLADSVYLYLGAVVDSSDEITEASEVNNSGQKLGGDYAPIAITLVTEEAETANSTPGSNDTLATAETIPANADVAGTLTAGDVDWYSFVGAPGELAVDLDSTDPGLSARLALYDSTGALLIDSDDSTDATSLVDITQYLASSGIFYLAVSARSANVAPSSYVLHVRLDNASAPNQPLPIPTGSSNYFLVSADLNRDGVPDLIVGSKSGGPVTVYLGDPLGGFGPATTLTDAAGSAAAVADFNGDGIPDLVLVNEMSETLYVLLGRGDGTFDAPSAALALPLPGSANSSNQTQIAVADMDGDGHLDVVVSAPANNGPSLVAVAYGRGDGTFDPTLWTMTGLVGVGIAVADFDGGGSNEIAVASRSTFSTPGSEEIAILQSDGHRGFSVAGTIGLTFDPTSIAAADLNGDGAIDLAVTESQTLSRVVLGAVAVFLGDGHGGFGPQTTFGVGDGPAALAIRDVSGDGRPDLLVANRDSNDVSVLLGNGDGTFASELRFVAGPTPTALAIADLDRDGFLDIATADSGSAEIQILRGQGAGSFLLDDPFRAGTGPVAVAEGDFNRDGFLDVVTADSDADDITVLLNRGDGTFGSQDVYAAGSEPTNIAVGDLNHDGRLDLVVTDLGSDAISVYLGRGDGTFLALGPVAVGFAPDAITLADFNGDGRLDVALTNDSASTVAILFGIGGGDFRSPVTYAVRAGGGFPTTSEIDAADFNGDGALDLAVDDGGQVTVLYGNPSAPGTFLPAVTVATGTVGRLSVADVNGDSLPDLILASQINPVSVLFSLGMSGFAAPQTLEIGSGGIDSYNGSFALSDFDDDGIPDLAIANGSMLAVARGNGDGTFQPFKVLATGNFSGSQNALVGDFNDDGHLDLLAVNQATNDVVVELGLGDGTFADVAEIGGAQRLSQPIAEDVNGDGLVDSFALSQDGQILFRLGQASGDSPYAPPTTINPGEPARAFTTLTIAGLPAVAAANTDSDTVSIYVDMLGFWSELPGTIPTGALPSSILAADVDGDGRDDLVIADNLDDTVTVAFQQPDGTFSVLAPIAVGAAPSDLAFAQSAAGSQVIVSDRESGDVSVLTFANRTLIDSTRFRAGGGKFDETLDSASDYVVHSLNLTTDIAVGNFNGDAYPDIIAVNQSAQSFSVLLGDADGGFSLPQPAETFATGAGPSAVVVGDFNSDGHDDLAMLMEGTGEVWIYEGDGHGGFTHTSTIAVGNAPNGLISFEEPDGVIDLQVANEFGDILDLRGDGQGNFVIDRSRLDGVAFAVVDLAGNGDQDVVVANQSLDHVEVLFRDPGQDAFQRNQTLVSGTQPILTPGAIAITDLNGDGIPDMIVANDLGNNVLVYPGLPGGQFGPPERFNVGFDPDGITIGDLNGDGVPDLVIPNKGSNDVSILLGRIDPLTGNWTAILGPRVSSGGSGPLSVQIVDGNGDGIPDLVVANQNGTVAELPGTGGGFFNDVDPRVARIRETITESSGDLLVSGAGDILRFDPSTFSFVTLYDGGGAVTATEEDGLLVAGFDDETVAVLSQGSDDLFSIDQVFEDFSSEVSALAVLQSGGSFEIYVSQVGEDVPTILSLSDFTSVLTVNLPTTEIEAIATTSGDGDLTAVAAISFKIICHSDDEPGSSESTMQFVTTASFDSGFDFPADEASVRAEDVRIDFGDFAGSEQAETNDPSAVLTLPAFEEHQLDLMEHLRELMQRYRETDRSDDAESSSVPVTESGLSKVIVFQPDRSAKAAAVGDPIEADGIAADVVAAPRGTPRPAQPSLAFLGVSLLTFALTVAEPKIPVRRAGKLVWVTLAKNGWPGERPPRRGRTIRARIRRIHRRIRLYMHRLRHRRPDCRKS